MARAKLSPETTCKKCKGVGYVYTAARQEACPVCDKLGKVKKTVAHARKKKLAPYTSDSLAVSRRMIAPGPFHEEQSVIYDLMWRFKHLKHTLAYYDRSTGKPIAEEAEKLRQEAEKRIEALPDGELRAALSREMYK